MQNLCKKEMKEEEKNRMERKGKEKVRGVGVRMQT